MQITDASLPILFLPMVWMGVLGTSLTFAVLARAHVDHAGILAALHIRSRFTFAICLYSIWTLASALLLAYFLGRQGMMKAAVGLNEDLTLTAAILAVGGAVLGIALWPILERITRFFGASMLPARLLDDRRSSRLSPWELVLLTTFGAIVVPAVEEFIFRGYVLTTLQEYVASPAAAIIFTSLIFASIHVFLGGGMMAYSFFLSLILSVLFLASDSLYPVILMHSLVNFWGFVIGPMLFYSESKGST